MKDVNRLDLNLLKAMDALLDERSVTRAAERLGVTQPAMSGMLVRLREGFGDPLFVRTQRGIVPTQRAQDLAAPVKQMLAQVDVLLRPPHFEPSISSLTLTIAATDYAQSTIAIPFLRALKSQAPHMRVALVPAPGGDAHLRLERGEIDLALITPETTSPDLHAHRLFDEHYVCAMRSGHPAARRDALTLDRFCELDFALVAHGFTGVTDDALAVLGRTRRVSLSVRSFLVLPELLRSSDLVSVVPYRLVASVAGLHLAKLPLPVPGFTKVAAWHPRTHQDPAHRWLRDLLFDTCRAPDAPAQPPQG